MDKLQAVTGLILSTLIQGLTLQHCVSKDGQEDLDVQCQKYCATGQCPSFCSCNSDNASLSCAPLKVAPNNSLKVNEAVKPGTPIFSIQVVGQETWRYTLGRRGSVDGSLWTSLKTYLKLTRIGRQYEMIVNTTPDLEYIYQRFGIKLTNLTLELACQLAGFPDKVNEVLLDVVPVNEYPPEFIGTPLMTRVPENTVAGTEIYVVSNHVIDEDVNPTADEIFKFDIWQHTSNITRDGREYFQMVDTFKGNIIVKADLDFEELQPLNATTFLLNISASDTQGLRSYATLIIHVEDVDDLPPEFYHSSCQHVAVKSIPCLVSYEASVPLNFLGEITNIKPGVVRARDMDSVNATVEYSLEEGAGEALDNTHKFSINKTTGSLFVVAALARRKKIQLVIVAREVSKMARTARASLYVTADDPVPVSSVKPDNLRHGHDALASSKSQSGGEFLVATVVLSSAVVLLLLMLLSLCIRLKTRSRRISAVQPAEQPNKQSGVSSQPSSKHLENEYQFSLAPVVPVSSSSYDNVMKEAKHESSNMGLPSDRNQQNAANNQHSDICLIPARIYNSPFRSSPQNTNARISTPALSSLEVGQQISFSLSKRPNTGSGHIWQQHIVAVTENPYAESILHGTTDSLALPDVPHCSRDLCMRQIVSACEDLVSQTSKDIINACTPLAPEIRSTEIGDNFRYQTSAPEVNTVPKTIGKAVNYKVKMTSSRSAEKDKSLQSQSKQMVNLRRKECSTYSSDDCNDRETDDEYMIENSSSNISTSSKHGSKSSTVSAHRRNIVSLVPLEKSSIASECESALIQPVAAQLKQKILQSSKKEAAVTGEEDIQLSKQVGEKVKDQDTEGQNGIFANEQQNVSQSQITRISPTNKVHSSEQNSEKVTTNFSLKANKALAINQMRPHTSDGTTCTRNALDVTVIRRPSVSAPYPKTRRINEIMKDHQLVQQNVNEAAISTMTFKGQTWAVNQARPHTSDDKTFAQKILGTTILGKSSASASSRVKRRTKKRKKFGEIARQKAVDLDQFVQERPAMVYGTSPDSYGSLEQDYGARQLRQQHRLPSLHPWTFSYCLTPNERIHHSLSDCLEDMHRPRYFIPLNLQQSLVDPGYRNVHINGPLLEPYTLLRHQQRLQFHQTIQEQQERQRLCSAFHRPDLNSQHSNGRYLLENPKSDASSKELEKDEDEKDGE